MKRIMAEWKKYNANSRNNDTSDCVLRAISLAYGLDYDEVHSELNKLARKIGAPKYNRESVFVPYLKNLGLVRVLYAKQYDEEHSTFTVAEFCERSPKGTYLLLTGKKPNNIDHMLCVIDGDNYDSWNSSNEYVCKIYVVKEDSTSNVVTVDTSLLASDLDAVIPKFLETQPKKMPYATFEYRPLHDKPGVDFGTSFIVVMKLNTEDIITYNHTYTKQFFVKCNPRKPYEEQSAQLIEKTRVAVREWIYTFRKEIEDIRKSRTLQKHPEFHGYSVLLSKLPEWSIPLITYVNEDPYEYEYDRFTAYMDALPGDPRGERNPEVSFRARNITELRSNLERYKANFDRIDYDY